MCTQVKSFFMSFLAVVTATVFACSSKPTQPINTGGTTSSIATTSESTPSSTTVPTQGIRVGEPDPTTPAIAVLSDDILTQGFKQSGKLALVKVTDVKVGSNGKYQCEIQVEQSLTAFRPLDHYQGECLERGEELKAGRHYIGFILIYRCYGCGSLRQWVEVPEGKEQEALKAHTDRLNALGLK